MNIFRDINEIKFDKRSVLTLGTFDGIHLGHQQIIKKVIDCSEKEDLRNLIITFHPHPRKVINPELNLKLLTTSDEQIEIFRQIGVANLLIINFTKEFSQLTPEKFIKNILVDKIGFSRIVIGYDHHFGKGRGGDVEFLKSCSEKYDFKVLQIQPFFIENEPVSSTKIRTAIETGDINKANKMLGRTYSFSGVVVEGDKRGRALGFPTANIKLNDEDKLLPQIGIYAVTVEIGSNLHKALLSIGKRPTFYNEGSIIPEVYIYDFNDDIYGKEIKVNVIHKLRGEEKFNSAEELIRQMNIDKENGLRVLNQIKELTN
ncbi:MAG: bifunctional riboflavin kinase/FAD synthetase [Ignavibacterium album]|uniref:bifunctional riboflavin kinase/FAD synthetase n=1 Tax=Ignavibacterium album TaxID=591197 RepID=UPI0026EFFD31|nr:bifunctional riboflavin kinase/FAD synthetase [Ignavibacterium album]MBI5660581.1 bifunctional riboflavin kinase/FAD synthetase [Ignavibacterium album]